MTDEKRYDGWSNYETWCVHSWLTNDEETREYWREEARTHREEARSSEEVKAGTWAAEQLEQFTLADQLKDEVEHYGGCSFSSLYTDLIEAALSEVNWLEIAEALLEGLEQEKPQPESADELAGEDDDGAASAKEFERAKRERIEKGIRPLFELGRIAATPGALATIDPDDMMRAIGRHVRGDWGEVDRHDWTENETSLRKGFRLLSVYRSQSGEKFWIITEADRSVTTVLLPSDY